VCLRACCCAGGRWPAGYVLARLTTTHSPRQFAVLQSRILPSTGLARASTP
jgi:hypothetical protein